MAEEDLIDAEEATPDAEAATETPKPDAKAEEGDILEDTPEDGKDDADLLSDDEESDAKDKVPEDGKYVFEPPEGVEVDDTMQAQLDAFGEKAKDMGLTQAQYQALVEYDSQRAGDIQQTLADAYSDRIKEWRTAAVADPELRETEEVKASSLAALNKFGSPQLKALLASPSENNPDGLGLGNHPEFLRFFHRVGAAVADPSLLLGEDVPDAEGALKRMYPTMYPDKT